MDPLKVRKALEGLISLGKELAPDLLFAYASYPSTEYLEPENADFTAFNVYLEDEGAFRSYVKRLHHIAGDRPLVISEFGLDSRRNGLERQAEKRLGARPLGQPLAAWLMRLHPSLPDSRALEEAIDLHQRLRFDPNPPQPSQIERLAELSGQLAAAIRRG
jgi:hypothetical protein